MLHENYMKTSVVYLIIAACAVSIGAAGGIIAKKVFGGEDVVYGDFDPLSLEEDSKQLVVRYDNYNGTTPEKAFSPAELISIGLEKYRNCDFSYSIGKGVASTIVSQTVRNFQIKNGREYFEESISNSSMVSLATRVSQVGVNGDITVYNGKAISTEKGSYPSEGLTYNQVDYEKYLGKTLDRMFIYIISDDTVINGSSTKTDSGYVVKVSLDADFGTYRYKYQMKNISNLDNLPTFDYVNLTFTFDNNMMLQHLSVDEKYQASMGITVSIKNSIEYEYYANQKLDIPSLDEELDYSLKGE